jgi:RNA polymerase sigma factor FliA
MATAQIRKTSVSKIPGVTEALSRALAPTNKKAVTTKQTASKAVEKQPPATKSKVVKAAAKKISAKASALVAKASESERLPAKRVTAKAAPVAAKTAVIETAARKKPKKVTKTAAELMAEKRRQYAEQFFPYIEKVARRLARRLPAHVEIDDLVSSGVIGLMEAAERFDPNRVDRFEAFAEFRIRGAMLDDLRSRDTLSRDMRRLSNELREATRKLESQLGRTPDQEELAKKLGVEVEELYSRQQKLSGSSVVGIDDAGPDFLERTCDETSPDPFEMTSHRETLGRLVQGIGSLPEKMQQVLSLYYIENLNLKEIGSVLGVTESRVCQIHGEATRRLREQLTDLDEAAA